MEEHFNLNHLMIQFLKLAELYSTRLQNRFFDQAAGFGQRGGHGGAEGFAKLD